MPDAEYEAKLYVDRSHADRALERLRALGYGQSEISLIVDERDLPADQSFESDSSPLAEHGGMGFTGMSVGAAAGGLLGAAIATAASIATVALTAGAATPLVIGPLAAAFVGLEAGAVSGVIVGGLLELGAEAEDWRVGLQNGGVVVVVALKSHADRAGVRKALLSA
jgi:hypothetical protein